MALRLLLIASARMSIKNWLISEFWDVLKKISTVYTSRSRVVLVLTDAKITT